MTMSHKASASTLRQQPFFLSLFGKVRLQIMRKLHEKRLKSPDRFAVDARPPAPQRETTASRTVKSALAIQVTSTKDSCMWWFFFKDTVTVSDLVVWVRWHLNEQKKTRPFGSFWPGFSVIECYWTRMNWDIFGHHDQMKIRPTNG